MRTEISSEAAKATPPAVVVAYGQVSGWTLNDWLIVATLGYVCLQACYLLWKWWREWHKA